jgi:site-specific DNA-methyltransferase (adenine-specific)
MARSIYGSQLQERAGQGVAVTVPATDDARRWKGWGTALKPAHEPIALARKPLDGTVAETVLAHGTGALNIEGCRIPSDDGYESQWDRPVSTNIGVGQSNYISDGSQHRIDISANKPSGRWPANFIHDGSDEVLELFPETNGGTAIRRNVGISQKGMFGFGNKGQETDFGYGDSGSAARFFYCAKASRAEREAGLDDFDPKRESDRVRRGTSGDNPRNRTNTARRNHHPTVKPIALMRYLIRLVTPPNGVVLDPFTGSGTTGIAARLEGFKFIGIEQSAEYADIAQARIYHA